MQEVEVKWQGNSGADKSLMFSNLDQAMMFSRSLGKFVTIKTDKYEIVGKFGVDSIENGRCPGGEAYTWYKRRKP
jgi:hypothetical protein